MLELDPKLKGSLWVYFIPCAKDKFCFQEWKPSKHERTYWSCTWWGWGCLRCCAGLFVGVLKCNWQAAVLAKLELLVQSSPPPPSSSTRWPSAKKMQERKISKNSWEMSTHWTHIKTLTKKRESEKINIESSSKIFESFCGWIISGQYFIQCYQVSIVKVIYTVFLH